MKVRVYDDSSGGLLRPIFTDFAVAGQDAFSLVPTRNLWEEWRLKLVNL